MWKKNKMTKISIGLKYGIALLAMALFVAFAFGCVSGTNGTSLEDAYDAAIEDAKIAEESEICSDLIPIVESNDYLIWKGEPSSKRVLVLTLVPYAYSSTYVGHEGENLTTTWGYSFVTVVPEVKDFIENCTVSEQNLTLRVEQLLGLPPKNESKLCVELWVDPDDLIRPCPDPEITDTESQLDFPENVSRDHVLWFFEYLSSVYYGDTFYKGLISSYSTGGQRFPWTRLGYTYDWGNPESEIGASEFVIRKNSVVTIESASNTSDYFSAAPSFFDAELAQKLHSIITAPKYNHSTCGVFYLKILKQVM